MLTTKPLSLLGHRPLLIAAMLAAAPACSLPLGQGTVGSRGAPAAPPPAPPQLAFPTPDLAAKHDAARTYPQSFDAVHAYGKALAEHCRGLLADRSCEPACVGQPVRYRPGASVDATTRALVEDALPRIEAVMRAPGRSWMEMGQLVAVKARLLGFSGRAADERALVDSYALEHADAFPVVERRLELLRDSDDAREAEAQCSRSRGGLKSAPEDARVELLAACVALHPGNKTGRHDAPDFAKYLPKLATDEQKLYRKYLARRCAQASGTQEAECSRSCVCDARAGDKQQLAQCKDACKKCRRQASDKVKACRRYRGA